MVIFFALFAGALNLNCLNSPCVSCLNNLIPYNSLLCIERCPYPYQILENPCGISTSLIVSVKFSEFFNFSADSVENFTGLLGLPFKDVSQTSPIPTPDQGFYFSSKSGLQSIISKVLSPDFKSFLVGLFKSPGEIFEIFYDGQSFFKISADAELIYFQILLQSVNEVKMLSYSIAFQTSATWMRLTFSLSHSSPDLLNIKIGNRFSTNLISMTGFEYHPGSGDALFLLGSNKSQSFKGFLFQFSYFLGASISDPIFAFRDSCLCDFNEYCSIDKICSPCPTSCMNSWPWCVREDCSYCNIASCSSCNSFSLLGCTSCNDSTKTPPNCQCGPHCTACDSTFFCTACEGNYILIDNKCLNKPFGYLNGDIQVVDYVFTSLEQFKFGVFQSGSDPSTFYPNNHEADDPIILKNRGAYLTTGKFFKSVGEFVINYQFALGFYFFGAFTDVFIFNELVINTSGSFTLSLTGIDRKADFKVGSTYGFGNFWSFSAIKVKFEGNLLTVYTKSNSYNDSLFSVEGFLFIHSTKQVNITSSDNIMIYSFVLYKDYYNLDHNYRKDDYKEPCIYSQYYNSYLHSCDFCDSGYCPTFGTSHYCKYVECATCTDTSQECIKGNGNFCNPGKIYFEGNCCHSTCKGCFDSHNFACFGCFDPPVLLGHTCVNSCPFGFNQLGQKCELAIINTVHIVFDDIFFNFSDKTKNVQVLAGNESTIYPKLFDSHPIPTFGRGFYFRKTSYVKTSTIKMSYNFTLFFLIKFESPGSFLSTNDLLYYMSPDTTVVIEDRAAYHKIYSNIFTLNKWLVFYVQFTASIFNSYQARCFVDDKFSLISFGHYIFTEAPTSFFFGSKVSSFIGFLYEFKAYNGITTPQNTIQVCTLTDENCLIDCPLNQVLLAGTCVDCNNCPNGCRVINSCSLCLDPLCVSCSLVQPGCLTCKENSHFNSNCVCDDGFFFDSLTTQCSPCSNNCHTCTSADSCECLENAHNENLECVCDDGFSLKDDGKCYNCHPFCKTCSGSKYFQCLSCSDYLLNSVCLLNCPFAFKGVANECLRVKENVMSVKFNGNFEIQNFDGIDFYDDDDFKPLPAILRGWYFDNQNFLKFKSITSQSILGIQFSILFWIKITKSGAILEILDKKIETLSLSTLDDLFTLEILLDQKYSSSQISPYPSSSWLLLSVIIDYTSSTFPSISINSFTSPWLFVSETPFNNTSQSTFTLGSPSAKISSFQGFLFEFHIKSSPITPSLYLNSNEFCNFFPINQSCISDCDFQSFGSENSCLSCKPTCEKGCRSEKHCNRCEDQFCEKCFNFSAGSCLKCKENFYFKEGKCTEKCIERQYLDKNSLRCENCSSACIDCDSSSSCKQCVTNSYFSDEGICKCFKGFQLELFKDGRTECRESYFNVTMTLSNYNQATLIFSESLESNLTKDKVIVKVNNELQGFSITFINSSWYLIVTESKNEPKTPKFFSIDFPYILYSKKGKMLYQVQLKARLFENEVIDNNKIVKNIKTTTSNSMIIFTSVVFSFSFFGFDIKSFINFRNSAELFYSVVLLDIEFDVILRTILSEIRYSSTLPSIFDYLIDSNHGVSLDLKFREYGYKTNLFLLNSGMHLMFLVILIFCYLIIKIIERFKNSPLIKKIVKYFEWDSFVKLCLNGYLELNQTALISILYSHYSNNVQMTDLIFSLIVLVKFIKVGNLVLIALVFIINHKYYKLESINDKKDLREKFSSLLSMLRINVKSFFYPIFLIRRFSFIFICLLKDMPTFQLSILLIFSLTNLWYLISRQDISDQLFKVHLIITEFSLIWFYSMILIKFVLKVNILTIIILTPVILSLGTQFMVIVLSLGFKLASKWYLRRIAPIVSDSVNGQVLAHDLQKIEENGSGINKKINFQTDFKSTYNQIEETSQKNDSKKTVKESSLNSVKELFEDIYERKHNVTIEESKETGKFECEPKMENEWKDISVINFK